MYRWCIHKHLNPNTQTVRPGTITSIPYKYLSRARIEPAIRSAVINHSATSSFIYLLDHTKAANLLLLVYIMPQ